MLDLLRELPSKADPSLFKVERWCTPDEGLILYALVQAHGIQTCLESGTANGYSASWMDAAGAMVHTWDIEDRPKIWRHPPYANGVPWMGGGLLCHVGRFEEGVGEIRYPQGPRLFYIDGHHSRTAVRRDWRAVRALMEPGDVVVLHDANEAPVADLCEKLRTLHGLRGGIVRTARGMGVYFA